MADDVERKRGRRAVDGRVLLGLGVLALAVIFVVLGVLQGDALVVLRKAILICYECIGIG